MTTLNVRIDAKTASFLKRVARRTGQSKSEVVRAALEVFRNKNPEANAVRPAQAIAHLIGCWDSGGLRLSERTAKRFARLLKEQKDGHAPGRRRSPGRAD
jgi:hypothetical protein